MQKFTATARLTDDPKISDTYVLLRLAINNGWNKTENKPYTLFLDAWATGYTVDKAKTLLKGQKIALYATLQAKKNSKYPDRIDFSLNLENIELQESTVKVSAEDFVNSMPRIDAPKPAVKYADVRDKVSTGVAELDSFDEGEIIWD